MVEFDGVCFLLHPSHNHHTYERDSFVCPSLSLDVALAVPIADDIPTVGSKHY